MNVPQGEIKGVKVTRQGIKNARPVITRTHRPSRQTLFLDLASNTFVPMRKTAPITAPSRTGYVSHYPAEERP
jgi:hypothetical protein